MSLLKGILVSLGLLLLWAQPIFSKDDFPTLKVSLARRGFKYPHIEGVEYFKECEVKDAVKFFIALRNTAGFKEAKWAVGNAMAGNPKLMVFLQEKLRSMPVLVENSSERQLYFQILVSLETDWVMELAGDILLEDKPLRTDMSGATVAQAMRAGGGGSSNTSYAAWTIGTIGYPGYPGGSELGYYNPKLIKHCQEFWKEQSQKGTKKDASDESDKAEQDDGGKRDKQ